MLRVFVLCLGLVLPTPVFGLGGKDCVAVLKRGVGQKMIDGFLNGVLEKKAGDNWLDQSATRITVKDGWCSYTNLELGQGSGRAKIADIRLRSPNLKEFADTGSLPAQLDFILSDFVMAPEFHDNPWQSYSVQAYARRFPIDLSGQLHLDATGSRFQLEDVTADFAGNNEITISLDASIVDDSKAWIFFPPIRTHSVSIRLQTNGLFEVLLGLYLRSGNSRDDVVAIVDAQIIAIELWMAGLSPDQMDENSQRALSKFIADFPNPTGQLNLSVEFPQGLAPIQAAGILYGGDFGTVKFKKLVVSYDRMPFDP